MQIPWGIWRPWGRIFGGKRDREKGVRAVAHRRRNRRRRRGSLGPLLRVLSVLLTAVAVVAALTLFFKVDQVVVSGNSR